MRIIQGKDNVTNVLIRVLKTSKNYLYLMLLLLLLSGISSIIEIGYMESIRRVVKGATESSMGMVYGGIIIGVIVIISRFLISTVTAWVNTTLNNASVTRLQSKMLMKISKSSYREISRFHTGDLTSRIWDSARDSQLGVNDHLLSLARNLIQLTIAFVYFNWINTTLSLGLIAYTVLFLFINVLLSRVLKNKHDQYHVLESQRDSYLTDVAHAPEEIRTYGLASYIQKNFEEKWKHLFTISMKISVLERILDSSGRISTFGGMIFILYVGGLQVYHGQMDIGGLAAFLVARSQLTRPLESLSWLWAGLMDAVSQASRVFTILDLEEEKAGDSSLELPYKDIHHKKGITLHEISFSYSANKEDYLSSISFTAPKNQVTVITGPSGCGKSTLLDLMSGLYETDRGCIYYDDLPVQSLSRNELRKMISIAPQEPFILKGTFRDNITFGNQGASGDMVIEAAQKANIHSLIMRQPLGYETIVGDQGILLSGGEKQRLVLARAFLNQPAFLLLDEPTSSQDVMQEKYINNILMQAAHEMTVVIISHRQSIIERADHVVYMSDGRVTDSGTHEQLMRKNSAYDQFIKQETGLEDFI